MTGPNKVRSRRSVDQHHHHELDYPYHTEEYHQDLPNLSDAPLPPFLPYPLAQNDFSQVKQAVEVAKKIGEELQEPNKMPEHRTLSRFSVLTRLVRVLTQNQIIDIGKILYTAALAGHDPHNIEHTKNNATWKVYRDAVAEAGTPASFVVLTKWIEEKKVRYNEAAVLIARQVKAIRYPTKELMEKFFEFATSDFVMKQEYLNSTAIDSLCSFLGYSQVGFR